MSAYMLTGMLFVVFSSAIAYLLLHFYCKRKNLYKDINKLHGPTVLGSVRLFLQAKNNDEYIDVIDRLIKNYPPPMKVWLGPHLCYVTTDPEELEIILKHPLAAQKPRFYKPLEGAFGQGIFTASGNLWKKNRKIIEPSFKQAILNNFVQTIVEKTKELMTNLGERSGKGSFDIFPLVNEYTLSVILEFIIGIDLKDVTNSDYIETLISRGSEIAFTKVFKASCQLDAIYKWTALAKEENEILRKGHGLLNEIINQRKDGLETRLKNRQNNTQREDDLGNKKLFHLTDLLLEKSKLGDFTPKQIRDEVMTLLITGHHTITFVLSMTIIMLGMFPEVQKKVYEEVLNVIGIDKDIDHSDLSKLQYLDMVIKETMRVFPITHFLGRTLQKEITLKSRILPKGLNILVPLAHIQRNEKLWPDPLKFIPERFTPEECAKRNSYAWLSFGAGLRNCLGMRFSLMEIKIAIATIIQQFVIKTNYNSIEELHLRPSVVNSLTEGFNCSLELRRELLKTND